MSHPREPLTRDRIIDAALRIVDGQGLSRLTMRRLGDSLEVEAMAIYHHLPRGKEALLDGLVEHVAVHPAPVGGAGGDWRQRLAAWADGYRDRLLGHAGVLPLLVTRRNAVALSMTAASLPEVLRQGGHPEAAAATGAHTLLSFVIGHTALEVRGLAARQAAGPEDTVDWSARFTAGLGLVLAGLATAR
jgi:TetR/AcrR family tetracycline transcriptional repressor